ncbi:MAG: rRNA maturation RNase YbeY [Clostridia bacterium]|nr:rRNA maturation RNase YbeY [Clostridia bacterium]
MNLVEVEFLDIEENEECIKLIERVANKCFEIQNLLSKNLYLSVILTNPENIRRINKEYRQVDKETDVLSFPMFEKDELSLITGNHREPLGDIMISIQRVKEQAKEYGHSFERELAYMIVHGFYHLMGYDHITDEEKEIMREKEEEVLELLNITRK